VFEQLSSAFSIGEELCPCRHMQTASFRVTHLN